MHRIAMQQAHIETIININIHILPIFIKLTGSAWDWLHTSWLQPSLVPISPSYGTQIQSEALRGLQSFQQYMSENENS